MNKQDLDFLCETVRFMNSIRKYENWELMQAGEISKFKKMTGAFNRIEKKVEAFQNFLGPVIKKKGSSEIIRYGKAILKEAKG